MNAIRKFILGLIVIPTILVLAGCVSFPQHPASNNVTHSSTKPSSAPKPSASAQTDPLVKGFGSVITYVDGVSVSVSQPSPFTPSDVSAGATPGQQCLLFNFTVTNGSKENLELMGFPQGTSGGQQASSITDLGAEIGDTPMSTLLPGQSITWKEGFSVADPTDVTLQFAPTYDYKTAIFDSKH